MDTEETVPQDSLVSARKPIRVYGQVHGASPAGRSEHPRFAEGTAKSGQCWHKLRSRLGGKVVSQGQGAETTDDPAPGV